MRQRMPPAKEMVSSLEVRCNWRNMNARDLGSNLFQRYNTIDYFCTHQLGSKQLIKALLV
jgi:hypothetical protein